MIEQLLTSFLIMTLELGSYPSSSKASINPPKKNPLSLPSDFRPAGSLSTISFSQLISF